MSEMYDDKTYEEWQAELEKQDFHNIRHLHTLFGLFGSPPTMLDVGCGTGKLVKVARKIGVEAYGVDQMVDESDERDYDKGWFSHHDLRHTFSLSEHERPGVVDLVLCWEVAEHIPTEYSDNFLNTLASHVANNEQAALVFTSAHPGQGGIAHENEKPAQFWRDELFKRGLNYKDSHSKNLALLWTNINSPLWWLASNVQVFKR